MGSDDIFKKRKAARLKRRSDYLKSRTESYLIVTEGTETEPSYFEGLKEYIMKVCDGKIDIVPAIFVSGQGTHTMPLLEKASLLKRNAGIEYNHLWIVMDKDVFNDFDEAIAAAESRGLE